jgi:hypothetical protein
MVKPGRYCICEISLSGAARQKTERAKNLTKLFEIVAPR